jgi:hypothetical protein
MSTSYTAILAVGKEFDYVGEVVDFLKEHDLLTEEDVECLEDEGDSFIQELLYDKPNMPSCESLNCYSGDGYYLGFNISCRSPEQFEKDYERGMRCWKALFEDVPAEVIHTVRVS